MMIYLISVNAFTIVQLFKPEKSIQQKGPREQFNNKQSKKDEML